MPDRTDLEGMRDFGLERLKGKTERDRKLETYWRGYMFAINNLLESTEANGDTIKTELAKS